MADSNRKLSDVILDIDQLIHADGGVGFIKIRAFCESAEALAAAGDLNAVRVITDINRIHTLLDIVVNTKG